MDYMYRRRYCSTSEKVRMGLKYWVRRNSKSVKGFTLEALAGSLWLLSIFFFLPVFCALFH